MKAKGTADLEEMQLAVGTPDKPTGHAMIVTPEYIKSVDALIESKQQEVNDLKDRVARGPRARPAQLREAQKDLALLEFFKQNMIKSKWSNAAIDDALESLKEAGIDQALLRRLVRFGS